jgi:hypothetical protein
MKFLWHRLRISFLFLLMASMAVTGLYPVVGAGATPQAVRRQSVSVARPLIKQSSVAQKPTVTLDEGSELSIRLSNSQRAFQDTYRQLPKEYKADPAVFQCLFLQGGFYSEINEKKVLFFLHQLKESKDKACKDVLSAFGEMLVAKVLKNVSLWPSEKLTEDEQARAVVIKSQLEVVYNQYQYSMTKLLFQSFVVMSRNGWKVNVRSNNAYELVSGFLGKRPDASLQVKSFLNAFQTFIVHGTKYGSIWFRHGKKIMIGSTLAVTLLAGAGLVWKGNLSHIKRNLFRLGAEDTVRDELKGKGYWGTLWWGFKNRNTSRTNDQDAIRAGRTAFMDELGKRKPGFFSWFSRKK